jgi:hypothetical protein
LIVDLALALLFLSIIEATMVALRVPPVARSEALQRHGQFPLDGHTS